MPKKENLGIKLKEACIMAAESMRIFGKHLNQLKPKKELPKPQSRFHK